MPDVFLSYAREDKARAEAIAKSLEAQGYEVFYDNEIPPGSTWADYLQAKIAGSKALVVIWTPASTQSQWVREEARIGRDAKKLVPIILDGAVPPFGFGEVQAVDLSQWRGDSQNPEWKRLLGGLAAVVQQSGGTVAQPKGPVRFVPMPQAARESQNIGGGGIPKPLIFAGLGVLALGLIVTMLANQPTPTQPNGQTPEQAVEAPAVTPSMTPAVRDAVDRALAAQRDARSAAVEARINVQTGQQAAAAARQGSAGFDVATEADGATTAGDIAGLRSGRAAAVSLVAADGSRFSGLMTVNGSGLMMNGSTSAGPVRLDGKLRGSDSEAAFQGVIEMTGRLKFEGTLKGGADAADQQIGAGVIAYSNGDQYEGEVKTTGEGPTMSLAKHGFGVLRSPSSATPTQGRFTNDAYTGPN